MSKLEEIIIRAYKRSDREFVRKIACDTAFMGEPAENFFKGRKFLSDFLTRYHTDFEPESIFVAERDGKIAGYLSGAKSEKKMISKFIITVLPGAFFKILFKGYAFKKKNFLFTLFNIRSFLKGEFYAPSFIKKEYPAILHINIDKNYRGLGIGGRLIGAYLNYLKKEKIKGVHIKTPSEKSFKFFEKLGFKMLYETRISYFRHVLKRRVRYIYFGKKLG
ncbi:MAG: GNAT family N-acetyltransferase [Actinomycetota bacterium]|nr:GNAT family N-acetyltransferase [Actinomycetota bacterium]